jgi:hypothetical protein
MLTLASEVLADAKTIFHPRDCCLVLKSPRFHDLQCIGVVVVGGPKIEVAALWVDKILEADGVRELDMAQWG